MEPAMATFVRERSIPCEHKHYCPMCQKHFSAYVLPCHAFQCKGYGDLICPRCENG